MHPEAGKDSETDLVEALVARVDDIDAQLRATAAVVDEKSLKELRRTLEALSKRDPKFEERVKNRVDVVADRLETLARTVSTTSAALAAKDGEIALFRRELDAGSDRFDSALAEVRRGLDPTALNEVKRALADLSKQKLPRGLEGRIEELGAKVAMLVQRIDTVSSTASTTAAGLAGRDGDVIALRRAYEADSNRIGAELADLRRAVDPTPVAELRQAVADLRERTSDEHRSVQLLFDETNGKTDSLSARVDTLAASVTSATARASGSEEQLSALRAHVEEGGVHLSSLAAAVATASERLDVRDLELEKVEHRFHDASVRVDGLVTELTRALAELPDPDSTQQQLETRLSELDRVRVDDRVRVEELSDRLESVAATVAATPLRAPESEYLERRLGELVSRIDASEDHGTETSSEVTRLAAILEVERGSLRARLDSLAASQERSSGALAAEELDRRVAALVGRFDTLERERDAQAAEIGRLASAFDVERTSFQTQLEALATALSWTSPKPPVEEQLDALTRRLGEVERQAATLASKVSHASTLVPTALRTLEARLDEVAPGPRRPIADRDETPALRVALEDDPPENDDADPNDDPEPNDEATYHAPTAVVPIRGPNP